MNSKTKFAMSWARSNFRHWRKRFSETYEQHQSTRPNGWDVKAWGRFYSHPFGDEWMNRQVRIVRAYLRKGK